MNRKIILLIGGALFVLAACSKSATAPTLTAGKTRVVAHDEGDYCDARTGYFVRSGRQTSEPCEAQ